MQTFVLVTTLRFQALAMTENAQIVIAATLGQQAETEVYGEVPGVAVTGTLGSADFVIYSLTEWGLLRIQ